MAASLCDPPLRLWDYEIMRLWDYEIMRLWDYENKDWSMTSLKEKLIKIGAKVVTGNRRDAVLRVLTAIIQIANKHDDPSPGQKAPGRQLVQPEGAHCEPPTGLLLGAPSETSPKELNFARSRRAPGVGLMRLCEGKAARTPLERGRRVYRRPDSWHFLEPAPAFDCASWTGNKKGRQISAFFIARKIMFDFLGSEETHGVAKNEERMETRHYWRERSGFRCRVHARPPGQIKALLAQSKVKSLRVCAEGVVADRPERGTQGATERTPRRWTASCRPAGWRRQGGFSRCRRYGFAQGRPWSLPALSLGFPFSILTHVFLDVGPYMLTVLHSPWAFPFSHMAASARASEIIWIAAVTFRSKTGSAGICFAASLKVSSNVIGGPSCHRRERLRRIAGIVATVFLGWLFLIAGIVGLVSTFRGRQAPGFWSSLLSALVALMAGTRIALEPASKSGHPT
jgi:Short repeat of unknown function (DUF308)